MYSAPLFLGISFECYVVWNLSWKLGRSHAKCSITTQAMAWSPSLIVDCCHRQHAGQHNVNFSKLKDYLRIILRLSNIESSCKPNVLVETRPFFVALVAKASLVAAVARPSLVAVIARASILGG